MTTITSINCINEVKYMWSECSETEATNGRRKDQKYYFKYVKSG
jgi:hypothetical protein